MFLSMADVIAFVADGMATGSIVLFNVFKSTHKEEFLKNINSIDEGIQFTA